MMQSLSANIMPSAGLQHLRMLCLFAGLASRLLLTAHLLAGCVLQRAAALCRSLAVHAPLYWQASAWGIAELPRASVYSTVDAGGCCALSPPTSGSGLFGGLCCVERGSKGVCMQPHVCVAAAPESLEDLLAAAAELDTDMVAGLQAMATHGRRDGLCGLLQHNVVVSRLK